MLYHLILHLKIQLQSKKFEHACTWQTGTQILIYEIIRTFWSIAYIVRYPDT